MTIPTVPPPLPDREPAAAEHTLGRLRRWALLGLGWLLVGLGILISPLPGPMGLPIAVLGGFILMRNSISARRWVAKYRQRLPNMFALLNDWRQRRRAGRQQERAGQKKAGSD